MDEMEDAEILMIIAHAIPIDHSDELCKPFISLLAKC